MATIKSKEQLLAEQRTFQRAYNRAIDTGDNSLTKDIVLNPLSVGGEAIFDQISVVQDLHVLSRLQTTDLDNEAGNYKLERLGGSYSRVVLTFYTSTTPSTTIVIPAGTQASTQGTSLVAAVTFSTIAEARFTAADAASYYSFDRARYEFNVTAYCDVSGAIGVVGNNLITKLLSPITGVSGVINLTASTGGLDQEIDDDLRKRVQNKKTGRDLNTVNGLKSYTQGLGFLDSYPIRQESTDVERYNGIDVFVINNSSETVTETFTYNPSQPSYFLTYRPVLEITSVVASIQGTLSSTQYDEHIDYTTSYRRSIYANDYITIRASALLVAGETITVTYNYSSLIRQSQDTLDLNENDVLTANVMLKAASPLYLFINASLTLKANADGPSTRNQCKNALIEYMSYYRLGESVQKSDLVVVFQNGYGNFPVTTVDAVIINSYYLEDEQGTVYLPSNEVITVTQKQYALYGSATIV